MTATRTTAHRCLALAQLRLTATDEAALTDARDYVAKALFEIEGLRPPRADPVAVALGRALRNNLSSAPAGTDASKATGARIDASGARCIEGEA